jgi:hypothetical protein
MGWPVADDRLDRHLFEGQSDCKTAPVVLLQPAEERAQSAG